MTPSTVKPLVHGCRLDKFVKKIREIPAADFSLAGMAQEAAHLLVPVLYQEQYATYVPHAMMALAVALPAADFLPAPEKKFPLIQALWLAGIEEKKKIFGAGEKPETGTATLQTLTEALAANDFKKVCAATQKLLANPSTCVSCRDLLLSTSLRDIANMGHKFLYVSKTLEFLDAMPKQAQATRQGLPDQAAAGGLSTQADAGKIMFPALHYLVCGPKDTGYFDLLQTKLKNSEKEIAQFAMNEGQIAEDEVKRLEHVLVYQYPGLIIENLLHDLQQGISVDELFQVTFAASAQSLLGAFKENWLYPVHGYNFAHQCREFSGKTSDPGAKMNFLFMAAMFVNKMAVKSMDAHKNVKFEEVDLSGQEVSLAGLEKAVEESRPEIASALALRLLEKVDFAELAAALVRCACKNDSGVCTGHDLKLAVHVLLDYPRMRIGSRFKPVAALAYFLAQVEKDYDLFKALTEKTAT